MMRYHMDSLRNRKPALDRSLLLLIVNHHKRKSDICSLNLCTDSEGESVGARSQMTPGTAQVPRQYINSSNEDPEIEH